MNAWLTFKRRISISSSSIISRTSSPEPMVLTRMHWRMTPSIWLRTSFHESSTRLRVAWVATALGVGKVDGERGRVIGRGLGQLVPLVGIVTDDRVDALAVARLLIEVAEPGRDEHLGVDPECTREGAQLVVGQTVLPPFHRRQLTLADAGGVGDVTAREARELPDRPQAGAGVLRACQIPVLLHVGVIDRDRATLT